jgi:hypothetical protein
MSLDSEGNNYVPTREQLWVNFHSAIARLTNAMHKDGYIFTVEYSIDDLNRKTSLARTHEPY